MAACPTGGTPLDLVSGAKGLVAGLGDALRGVRGAAGQISAVSGTAAAGLVVVSLAGAPTGLLDLIPAGASLALTVVSAGTGAIAAAGDFLAGDTGQGILDALGAVPGGAAAGMDVARGAGMLSRLGMDTAGAVRAFFAILGLPFAWAGSIRSIFGGGN